MWMDFSRQTESCEQAVYVHSAGRDIIRLWFSVFMWLALLESLERGQLSPE